MKLNLLPTYVSKEKVTRSALLFSILLFVVCVLGAIGLYYQANKDLADSQTDIGRLRGEATRAKETADVADKVMADATPLLRNTQLAQAMLDHERVYPDLYDKVKLYIPNFYRVNSMSAAALGPGQSSVTLVGVLDTYQQYADLMLALLRMPGVTTVSRTGFTIDMPYVPGLTPEDQIGKPHKPGEAPIPDDPLKRLEYFQGKGTVTGFTGTGGFGSGTPGTRGAMPGESTVTVTLVISGVDLQVPDPKATLQSGGGDTSGGTGPGATGGQTPNMAPTTTPTPSPQPDTGGGRRGPKRGGAAASEE